MGQRLMREIVIFLILIFAWPALGHNGSNRAPTPAPAPAPNPHQGVFTRSYNNMRTNLDSNETYLTPQPGMPGSVSFGNFGRLAQFPTNAYVFAQPLYVTNVNIPGQGTKNVLYVADESDTVYAFDASGKTTSPLWEDQLTDAKFLKPADGQNQYPLTGQGAGTSADIQCPNIAPFPGSTVGINGTPVIDPATNTLYVVTVSKDTSVSPTRYYQYLHALDITTGAEKYGGPVMLPFASTPSTSGNVLDALHENQHEALALEPGSNDSDGKLYIAFSSNCDEGPYTGLILTYNAPSLAHGSETMQLQNPVWQSTSQNGNEAGIWSLGSGPAIGPNGNVYVATGNGAFDGQTNFGCSVLKLGPTSSGGLIKTDFFAPFDQANMNTIQVDLDVGSGGVMLLPDQSGPNPHLAVAGGKAGQIYLLNRDNMGGYSSSDSNFQNIVQSFNLNGTPYAQDGVFNGMTDGLYSSPAYFNDRVYYAPVGDYLRAYQLTNGLFTSPSGTPPGIIAPVVETNWTFNWPGGTPTISSDGNNNGILWFVDTSHANDPPLGQVPASLYAFDATTLHLLWSSDSTGSNCSVDTADQLGWAVKHVSPTVYNGDVYVGTKTGVDMYGTKAGLVQSCVADPSPTPTMPSGATITMQYDAANSTCGSTLPNSYYNFMVQRCVTSGNNYPLCATSDTTANPVYYANQFVDLQVNAATQVGLDTNSGTGWLYELIPGANKITLSNGLPATLYVEEPEQFNVSATGYTTVSAKFYCVEQ